MAVVDSGIDAGHPDLEGKVAAEAGVVVTTEQSGEVVVTPGPARGRVWSRDCLRGHNPPPGAGSQDNEHKGSG